MASLLSSVVAAPNTTIAASTSRPRSSLLGGRKRKSSPDYPDLSSEGMAPSSDSLYPHVEGNMTFLSSDGAEYEETDAGLWDYRSSTNLTHKKPRTAGGINVKQEPIDTPRRGVSFADDGLRDEKENMNVDEHDLEEDDDFSVLAEKASKSGGSTSKAQILAMVGSGPKTKSEIDSPAVRSRRDMVNSTSISAKATAAAQALKAAEDTAREVKAASLASMIEAKSVDGKATNGKSWMAIQEGLNTGSNATDDIYDEDDDLFNASVKLKAVKKGRPAAGIAIGPLHRVDAFEPLEGDTEGKAVTSSKPGAEEEQERTLRMYWLDYLEGDQGIVHLVGKVFDRTSGKYVSACVTINGMQRNLFVLPRTKREGDFPLNSRNLVSVLISVILSQRTATKRIWRFLRSMFTRRSTPSVASMVWKVDSR